MMLAACFFFFLFFFFFFCAEDPATAGRSAAAGPSDVACRHTTTGGGGEMKAKKWGKDKTMQKSLHTKKNMLYGENRLSIFGNAQRLPKQIYELFGRKKMFSGTKKY